MKHFLDKMIALVEGASRQKTPNEIALTILLAGFTLDIHYCLCNIETICRLCKYTHHYCCIYFFVCLFDTHNYWRFIISAIGIAGMDRALRANVITKSGKAVETAGDLDILLLDKTGTITIGNRKATNFYPADGMSEKEFIEAGCIKFTGR